MADQESDNIFGTTRGRLLLLLCGGTRTVNELMDALRLTDNAVRAQLTNLQQEGYVRPVGLRAGTRKPHVDYELTPQGRSLLPVAYEPVLRTLVDVLRERLTPEQMREVVKDAARRLLGPLLSASPESGQTLENILAPMPGVHVSKDTDASSTTIRACACPLASITANHPEVCESLAEVLSEMLGNEVRQCCDRREWPQCRFEVREPS